MLNNDDVQAKIYKIEETISSTLNELNNAANNVYIVNAGRMNHGKSSLFNSILKKPVFAVGDVRTTTQCTEVKYKDKVFFVDTPGLDAKAADDRKAFEAYRKANLVIFVHTPNIGEMHKDELDRINQIAKLFPNKTYFWKHFCLVLTFREAINENGLEDIKRKIVTDIEQKCGGKDFPVFLVSNLRYQKGMASNKKNMIAQSGIQELRNYIDDNIIIWKKQTHELNLKRLGKIKKESLDELDGLKTKLINVVNQKKNTGLVREQRIRNILNDSYRIVQQTKTALDNKKSYIETLERQLSALEERHRREYY